MKDINSQLQSILYEIHLWGKPEQHPMKRMFSTRGAGILCLPLEIANLVSSIFKLTPTLLPRDEFLKPKEIKVFSKKSVRSIALIDQRKERFKNVLKQMIHLSSAIFLGVIFSPELNYRLHNS